jgi:hypothetical protein
MTKSCENDLSESHKKCLFSSFLISLFKHDYKLKSMRLSFRSQFFMFLYIWDVLVTVRDNNW